MANIALFPEISPLPKGIAAMAAVSAPADSGHNVEFRSIAARSILSRITSKRDLPFTHGINPYRGCEFACRYCYARYTHEFMELRNPEDFEKRIFVKQNTAWLLEQELRGHNPKDGIALGTATDPYQPIERRAKVTQGILEVFAKQRGLQLGIVTKSALIVRDVALLQQIARRNSLTINVTITTTDVQLARKLEPRAPRPDLRFRALATLRAAGLRAGVLCCPVLPGITDSATSLGSVVRRARAADASFFCAQPLFLKPCSKPVFDEFVRREFPTLSSAYQQRYGDRAFVTSVYARQLQEKVRALCRKHGLRSRHQDTIFDESAVSELGFAQLDLFCNPGARPV